MESPSAPACKRHVPWQGLLLAVSLSTFWNLPTTAQLTIESVPPSAAEGKDVLLLVHNLTENVRAYVWYKGESVERNHRILSYNNETSTSTPGPLHSGREIIYANGSLLFQNVTLNDTGYYTLQVTMTDFTNDRATGYFRVYPPLPKPNITSNNSNPEEHKDAVLLACEPESENITYLWLINSQSLQDSARLELSKDNRTLTLLHVTRNDTGPYECETRNPVSLGHSDPFTLNVLYGPDAPTISPSDSHYRPGANLRLSCHATSNPPAQYSWLINGRPQQPTQELFITSITANDSGSYTCLAHNPDTGLNRTTVKTITVSDFIRREDTGVYQCEVFNPISSSKSEPLRLGVQYVSTSSTPGLSGGAIAGIVIGVLAVVALIIALVYFLYIRKTGGETRSKKKNEKRSKRKASDQHDATEYKPSASKHSQGHSENSPNKIHEVTYSSLNFNAQEAKKPTAASPFPVATEMVYSEVKKK